MGISCCLFQLFTTGGESADSSDWISRGSTGVHIRPGTYQLSSASNFRGTLNLLELQVYDWNSRQQDIYTASARPIVDAVLSGYNGIAP